jgi:hypothetical protein
MKHRIQRNLNIFLVGEKKLPFCYRWRQWTVAEADLTLHLKKKTMLMEYYQRSKNFKGARSTYSMASNQKNLTIESFRKSGFTVTQCQCFAWICTTYRKESWL